MEAAEKAEADAEAKAAAQQTELEEATKAIKDAVQRNMTILSDFSDDLKCVVQVKLKPNGDVIDVEIFKSSGNAIFDSNAKAAVMKSSPLRVPKDKELFNKEFKSFKLPFKAKE